MVMIYTLLVAHFVADFLCQTDWMALNKSKRWDALLLHVCAYWTVMSLAVAAALVMAGHGDITRAPLVVFGCVNFAAHFVQDAITSRWTSRLWFLRLTSIGQQLRPNDLGTCIATGMIARNQEAFWVDDTGTRHWFFVVIGFDQLLHYVTLFVTASWWLR